LSKRPVIEINDLCKIYRTKTDLIEAVQDITFDIKEESFVSIIGPSGCGKSTLLKIIGGVIPATKGSVKVEGGSIRESQAKIGMVFQSPVLLKWRTIINNVLLPIEILKYPIEEYREKAENLLELVGLKGFEDKYPHELSGGMQQRASISRALIFDPKLLLMDEPFGALDALTRDILNQELLRIWRAEKQTILFVTHNIPEAVYLSDTVIVLTPRPARIAETFEIDLPRPRNIEMQAEREFGETVIDIREKLFH
jgi:NitT/TauT family transport system ATP-binding protein